jgi:cytochrome c553
MRNMIAISTLLLAAAAAGAQAPDRQAPDRQARVWAASCAACHGTGGQSQGGIPPIGRDAALVYRALQEFKNNQRPATTVMHQHARGYTDAELERIAAVFAAGK